MHLLCGSSRAMKRAHGGIQRRNSMALHREENKVPLMQSPKCKWIIAKGSWVRNRNNEGQCDRFVKAEKSEEWMARSPVWPDDVIASETASRHQPMNWRDSIWVQTRSRSGRSRCVSYAVLSYLWKRTTESSARRHKNTLAWFHRQGLEQTKIRS